MLSNTRLSAVLASCRIVILSVAMLGVFPAFCEENGHIEATDPVQFPDISYKDAQDQTRQLKQDLGKLTIVHFWATWCVPCVAELPELDAFQKAYAAQGLKVIDISEDGATKLKTVQDFFSHHSIASLTPYLDADNGSFREAKGRGLPTSYFIDAKGQKIAIAEGPIEWQSDETKAFIEEKLKAK